MAEIVIVDLVTTCKVSWVPIGEKIVVSVEMVISKGIIHKVSMQEQPIAYLHAEVVGIPLANLVSSSIVCIIFEVAYVLRTSV